MSITFDGFCGAIRQSLSAQLKAEREDRARLEEKRRKIEAEATAWQLELKARETAAMDADGRIEAARIARQERQEQERLDFIAAAIVRQTAKLSKR